MIYDKYMRRLKLIKKSGFVLFFLTLCLFTLFPFSSQAYATTIVLDPGHSFPNKQGDVDPGSKLKVGDNDGAPGERAAMQNVANEVESDLKKDGYTVVMTKTSTDSYVSLLKRAQIANAAHADLAVSLHYDYGHSFGSWAQIYAQHVGLSRYNFSGNTRINEKTFTLSSVAQKSQDYAQIFKTERGTDEGFTPDVTTVSFNTRGSNYSSGNIPIVQLFATVPWVYNEVGGLNFSPEKYRKSIVDSIEKAIPPSGGNTITATSNCAITLVGNPGADQGLPAGCTGDTAGGGNQSVVELARKHLQGSYIWAAPQPRVWADWNPNKNNAPTHFDCSGFAGWVWYWATNGKVNLPGQTDAIWLNTAGLSNSSVTLTRSIGTKANIQPGDLVFFGSVATTEHMGIYEGQGACGANDCFLEWYTSGQPGRENSLAKEGSWYVGFVHIVVH